MVSVRFALWVPTYDIQYLRPPHVTTWRVFIDIGLLIQYFCENNMTNNMTNIIKFEYSSSISDALSIFLQREIDAKILSSITGETYNLKAFGFIVQGNMASIFSQLNILAKDKKVLDIVGRSNHWEMHVEDSNG